MTFKDSWLWRKAFVEPREDANVEEQIFFRTRYEAMREKAAQLVSRISSDMEHMTVHDISHLDALWEMASIVTRNRVELNPPEAFVFGGAVLLHDAAMTLAAYKGGLAGLKGETAWKDSYARILNQTQDRDEEPDIDHISELATAEALRGLHALKAEQLPTMSWEDKSGHPEFLIDDPEVRNFYGSKIGRIAHSHWWQITQMEDEFCNNLGPLGGRTNSRIDLVNIASILRLADAMHLDRRRAPAFLRKLLQPEGISQSHWEFQERMAVPFVDGETLVYSAAPPFELKHSRAWWLAYDAATVVDRELREVDHLLQRRGTARLAANRVKAVDSPFEFSRHVETAGWTPVDSMVRVSDVPKIVATLGGSKLYGDNPKAAVRELIQNAADAIVARRRLQMRSDDWGEVTVGLSERSEGTWLWIEDCGVGMSSSVLTGPLIDFGNSFWRSPFASQEFPGLQAAGFRATGRYGIGFFSIFMLGDRVRVTSRRYDRGSDAARVLEFMDGLGSRPILYSPNVADVPMDGGTRVEVLLKMPHSKIFGETPPGGDLHETLSRFILAIAPNLGVTVDVISHGKKSTTSVPGDWLTISENDLVARIRGVKPRAGLNVGKSRLRILADSDGVIYGRASIAIGFSGTGEAGCVSVGGLKASELPFIRGIMIGRESTASRNEAHVIAPASVLAKWATEQAQLISKSDILAEDAADAAQIVLHCGGNIGRLPVARLNSKWVNELEVLSYLVNGPERIAIYDGPLYYDEDQDLVHPREFKEHMNDARDTLFLPRNHTSYYDEEHLARLKFAKPRSVRRNLSTLVKNVITRNGYYKEGYDSAVVANVLGSEIIRDMMFFRRNV